KAEVELYKVKDRINQLYLGVLLTDQQIDQIELVKTDLRSGIYRVAAQVQNGTALRSNQLTLEAELLKNEQRTIELKANRQAFLDVLSLFLGRPLPENTRLQRPEVNVSLNPMI